MTIAQEDNQHYPLFGVIQFFFSTAIPVRSLPFVDIYPKTIWHRYIGVRSSSSVCFPVYVIRDTARSEKQSQLIGIFLIVVKREEAKDFFVHPKVAISDKSE